MSTGNRFNGFSQRLASIAAARGVGASSIASGLTLLDMPVSQGHISHMLHGRRENPSAALVGALSTVLDVDVRYWYDADFAERLLDDLAAD